jgi:hypothetical protein
VPFRVWPVLFENRSAALDRNCCVPRAKHWSTNCSPPQPTDSTSRQDESEYLPLNKGKQHAPSRAASGFLEEFRAADWGRFFEWKRIEREDEPRRVALEVMIRGTCDKIRLLDLVENFTLFSEHKAGLIKIIGQNHQFLGVNNTIASV